MKKIFVLSTVACLSIAPLSVLGGGAEKYEAISQGKYKPNLMLPPGASITIHNGVPSGGPVKKLSFCGRNVELSDNVIRQGFLNTRDYGKVKVLPSGMTGFDIELTAIQQKKILQNHCTGR